jgi:hypothetical protein
MHRWFWDFRPTPPATGGQRAGGAAVFGGRGVPAVLPGDYTLKLTVGGRSYTQPLHLSPDPRTN